MLEVGKSYTAYFSFRGFEQQLKSDLKGIIFEHERIFVTEGPAQKTYWSQNTWHEAKVEKVESIGKAAAFLKAIQRNWFPYHISSHRRLELIQSKLPFIKKKRWDYLKPIPNNPVGSYTLLGENTLFYASKCSEKIPEGELEFNEDKHNPPSRAYLKLWETFTRLQRMPKEGDKCLELGACPGGWTWVIAGLGASVTAVDRSPLDPKLMNNPLISFESGDAFKYLPDTITGLNWIFSDLICYPSKLYEFVIKWLETGEDINYVCTIKFQGEEHYEWVEKFEKIPGSQVLHLYHNKHEFTWINLAENRHKS